ncbi:peptide ABC transporter substrate-binding protein [Francisella adeliensis]|uniref:Peptide ABC transporter substrate-binding protein n=1 Tax=Francisella adeliensis TaxID=2007306 RepID=A0A2Z4Y0C6_9GAMM|nr:peptide ABC transporter substrate-binding protein [Francisella adeliensis]AXA34429.1 peptide ABC transporter substrate-binding protein [Francisella adeliensis]MBK2086523.1 peptide ABC transporter substrate-binding protein [Francisella adeliensis]MBK2096151.1 peptide ABC transporter substrate-binding protein [Francisella adeliensis]QIW12676.1 peptide ABC transporter substrate-binding protein [Francisella adeliensis]QIW14552.1 peptide ABC transporter substrate-binding protein [Francisella ade
MFKKTLILTSIVSLILIAGCSNDSNSSDDAYSGQLTKDNNQLVVNIGTDMPSIDPQQSSDNSSSRVIEDIFEGLVDYNQKSEVIPTGASSWDISEDGKTYTFHLRKNAKWTNGDPVTAEDYVYSYRRSVTPATLTRAYASYFNPIVNAVAIQAGEKSPDTLGVKALDKYTLQITLAAPNPTFLDSLTIYAFFPVNKKAIDKYGDAWAAKPRTIISNGAYKLTKWIHNGYALAEKSPNYWDAGNVSIDSVKYLMIADVSSDLENYKAGGESITYSRLPANTADWYKENFTNNQFQPAPMLSQAYFVFNMRDPKFQDIRVRKALSMVIDREGIANGVKKGLVVPSYLVVPEAVAGDRYKDLAKDIPGYDWINQPIPQRIREARELLKEAGYSKKHPLEFTVNFNTSDINRLMAQVLQGSWQQDFGDLVKIDIFNEDWKVYLDSLKNGNFDVGRMAWIADFNQPNTYTEMYTCHSDNNKGDYCDKAADKIYKKSLVANSKEEFYELQRQLIIKQTAGYPIVPLFTEPAIQLVQPYVKGFKPKGNVMGRFRAKQLSITQSKV